jgi:UDP-4-amino-4,6-dideoxy-N-acetyl-beta-L-altrosamine N-acetyltransferase
VMAKVLRESQRTFAGLYMSNAEHSIRLVTESDLPMILDWRNNPKIRIHMYHSHLITLTEHVRWFHQSKRDDSITLLLYQHHGSPQGFINFTDISGTNGEGIWGFYLSPHCKLKLGKAMGKMAISYGFRDKKYYKIWGEVLKDNIPSQKYHQHLGFVYQGNCQPAKSDFEVYRYSLDRDTFLRIMEDENDIGN